MEAKCGPVGIWVDGACSRQGEKNGSEDPPLHGPEDVELLLDAGEIFVAGGESGFALEGEGGGEAVHVGEMEGGFEFGGEAREFDIGGYQLDRQLRNLRKKMASDSGALVAPDGIVDFAPIHNAHKEFALAIDGELKEMLDLFSARTVGRKGHEGAGVENDAFHSAGRFMARLISWIRRLQLALAAALFEENFQGFGVFAEAAAEAADKFRGERLEDEAVFLLEEGDLGSFFDGVFAAELGRNDQLAFGGDGGDFGFHGGSGEWDLEEVYRVEECKSMLGMAYILASGRHSG